MIYPPITISSITIHKLYQLGNCDNTNFKNNVVSSLSLRVMRILGLTLGVVCVSEEEDAPRG